MTTHTVAQTLNNIRQTIGRYVWWLGLSLVLVVATLAAYRSVSAPTVSIPEVRSIQAPAARLDPAQQGIFDYLRVHSGERASRAAPSLDAAQQSVMDYLRAHSTAQPLSAPATSLDPAQQSVMDYLRAHSAVQTRPLDPATQSVLDYLRAHSR
ncbi:MAG TPA: hypothetical protein VGJ87_17665 [Roseiflexaceae bacterium]|jgi:hypothetical protein